MKPRVAVLAGLVLLSALTACAPVPAASPAWPRPANVSALVRAAGLEMLPAEGTVMHIHSHLDVFYGGHPVPVPANVGIEAGAGISPLHTHDPSGLLHVESPVIRDFTLGQFFVEWNVPLSGARAWVDGKEVASPAAIVLADKQQITVAYGPPPATIPSTYPAP